MLARFSLLLGIALYVAQPATVAAEEIPFDPENPPQNARGDSVPILYSQIVSIRFSDESRINRSQMQELSSAKTKVEEDKDQIVIELRSDALFDFDRSDIRQDANKILQEALTVIKKYRGMSIQLGGHTDSKGSDDYNFKLSQARASSVREWLTRNGIASGSMNVTGYGESKPRAANTRPDGSDWPEGRALNRRVEIVMRKQ